MKTIVVVFKGAGASNCNQLKLCFITVLELLYYDYALILAHF